MNLRQFAVVMLRIFSIWWFVDALLDVIVIPTEVYGILHYKLAHLQQTETDKYLAMQREIALVIVVFKTLVFLVLGLVFMVFARPLARLFTQGVENGPPV